MYLTQSEAKIRRLLVYNSGKICTNGHNPTVRITTTGRCMDCEKDYHKARSKAQVARSITTENGYQQLKVTKSGKRACYTMTFPDGERVTVGPYTTAAGAMKALNKSWNKFYGINFDMKFMPHTPTDEKQIYEWPD